LLRESERRCALRVAKDVPRVDRLEPTTGLEPVTCGLPIRLQKLSHLLVVRPGVTEEVPEKLSMEV